MTLDTWASEWGIPQGALKELRAMMGVYDIPATDAGRSEAAVQQVIRLEAPRHGAVLWRNNVGVAIDPDTGQHVRFGLANDSKAVNKRIKSSDLIGITPYVIRPPDIGRTVGIFTAVEVKSEGWSYKGTEREAAQLAFHKLVISKGGLAKFATSPEEVWP